MDDNIKPNSVIAGTYFASISTECYEVFQSGYYFSCISLVQSVAEGLVKFLCEKNGWPPCKDFEDNVKNLEKRKFISNEIEGKFITIWKRRNDYHHLNKNIETEKEKLKAIASEKLLALSEIENEIFAAVFNKNGLQAKYPQYWPKEDDKYVKTYLRID